MVLTEPEKVMAGAIVWPEVIVEGSLRLSGRLCFTKAALRTQILVALLEYRFSIFRVTTQLIALISCI
jgi:hypothetical protein